MKSVPLRYVFLALSTVLVVLTSSAVQASSVTTYLALGDSLAFGVGANDTSTDVSNGDRGYVGPFTSILASRQGGITPNLINLGVSGETSSSFFQGGTGLEGPDSALRNTNYPNPPVSQNSLMLAEIVNQLAAGNTISNVTIQLGANDLYQVLLTPGFFGLTQAQQETLFLQALTTIATNDAVLLTELHALVPSAQIALMGYYDPYAPFLSDPSNPYYPVAEASHVAIPLLDQIIQSEADAFQAVYVDEYSVFVGNELTDTYILNGNSHPTLAGYALITQQLDLATVPEPGSSSLAVAGSAMFGLHWLLRLVGRRHR